MKFGDTPTQWHCRSCHLPGADLFQVDEEHRIAAEMVYHDDKYNLASLSPSEACLLCHDSGPLEDELQAHLSYVPRFNAHASHPYGIRFTPGQGSGPGTIRKDIDPRLTLADGKIECQTCHLLPGNTKDLLVPFDDPYALCLGCHDLNPDLADYLESLVLAGD